MERETLVVPWPFLWTRDSNSCTFQRILVGVVFSRKTLDVRCRSSGTTPHWIAFDSHDQMYTAETLRGGTQAFV